MALAQPTGLTVQTLEPLVAVEQSVERDVAAGPIVTLNQYIDDSASLAPAVTIGITQLVDDTATVQPAETLVGLLQLVDDTAAIVPAQTLVTLDQSFITYSDQPSQTLVTIAQAVEQTTEARALVRLRQNVLSVAEYATQPLRIYLDGQDITARCLHNRVTITAGEGENRTAEVSYLPPKGTIDVPAFQGKPLEITREQGGQTVALFTGVVDEPVYQLDQPRNIRLRCSDLRSERLGRETQSRLKTMTGGLYSDVVQREDATGEEWVREMMRTVSGSLDYTGSGALRYSAWGTGTPAHTLQAGQIHYLSNSLSFSQRDQIVNRVKARLEYRYFQRNTFTHAVDLEMQRAEGGVGGNIGALPYPGHTIPTKDALRSAIESVSGWRPMEVTFKPIAADGWYKYSAADTNKTAWTVNPVFRELRAMGVDATLERYISQPKRETYELEISAPQSIEQYGEIEGRESRVATESRVDPSVFEERGCVIIANPDDRRAEVELAMQTLQAIARKEILGSHRQNEVNLRYKPERGDPGHGHWLALEIGQTIAVSLPELQAVGQVVGFQHVEQAGDRWTDFSLAVSQVNSTLSVSEDWTLPAPPATYKLSPTAQPTMTPACPLPADEHQVEGVSRIEPDGTVYVVAPVIGRGQVDEIIGTRKQTYPVAIPKDLFQVEVP